MISAVLTIDDVASNNTPAIADYLESRGIQAIMFACGKKLEQLQENGVYALKHGMILGNHSDSHPHFSQISYEEGCKEIERCEEVLNKVYQEAKVERRFRPFRFPYGDKGGQNKGALQKYLKDNGFHKVKDTMIPFPWWKEQGLHQDMDTFWTFDFMEYRIRPGSGFTLDQVWDRIHGGNQGAPLLADGGRHILLLHAHDETEELAPKYYQLFIDRLLQSGVVFDRPEVLPAK